MSTFRGFIAIETPITPKILELEKEIQQIKANVKLVEPQNIHITLKFLGDVDENNTDQIEQIIIDAIKGVKPFQVILKKTGVFPNINYLKVIWIGIEEHGIISTIAEKLEKPLETLGFPREKRGFSPHLTIGRVKTAEQKEKLLKTIEKYANEEFGEYHIDKITLKKSDLTPKGPIYTTVREVKL